MNVVPGGHEGEALLLEDARVVGRMDGRQMAHSHTGARQRRRRYRYRGGGRSDDRADEGAWACNGR